jgi:hypothetical protein
MISQQVSKSSKYFYQNYMNIHSIHKSKTQPGVLCIFEGHPAVGKDIFATEYSFLNTLMNIDE